MSTGTEGRKPTLARPEPAPATLRSILDVELAITMRAESNAAARRIARQMCHDGITKEERVAMYEFLHKVAEAVRYPEFCG